MDTQYPSYSPPDRALQRCASQQSPAFHFQHASSGGDTWLYQNYISPPLAFNRAHLSSGMYNRAPDQNYPSPSPSVPSPGPRPHSQLEHFAAQNHPSTTTMNSSNDAGTSLARGTEPILGPVRNVRSRQATMNFKQCLLGRRQSMSGSIKDEGSPQIQHSPSHSDTNDDSRPQTPVDSGTSEYVPNRNGLSLNFAGMDSVHLHSPYQPATPSSLCSPYTPYSDFGHGRLPSESLLAHEARQPSPANSIGSAFTSESLASTNQYQFAPVVPIELARPTSRPRKHTKKRLDSNDKKQICLYHLNHQNARQEDIAEAFGIERSTVSKILKAKDKWLNVKDTTDSNSKNRPSKFPELEEVMRRFLQECIDTDTGISDSLIRTRALEVAKDLCIFEDKFKASSGWIENFKHRHEIKSGKWIKGIKNVAASQTANPGLSGDSNVSTRSPHTPATSYQPQHLEDTSNESLIKANRFDSPELEDDKQGYHGDREHQQRMDDPQFHWSKPAQRVRDQHVLEGHAAIIVGHSSQHHSPPAHHPSSPVQPPPYIRHSPSGSFLPLPTQPPLVMHSVSALAEAVDQVHPERHEPSHQQVVDPRESNIYVSDQIVYPSVTIAAVNDMPTITDAENAVNLLITFLDRSGHQIIEPHERETLTTIKCALFQFASGVPFNRN